MGSRGKGWDTKETLEMEGRRVAAMCLQQMTELFSEGEEKRARAAETSQCKRREAEGAGERRICICGISWLELLINRFSEIR